MVNPYEDKVKPVPDGGEVNDPSGDDNPFATGSAPAPTGAVDDSNPFASQPKSAGSSSPTVSELLAEMHGGTSRQESGGNTRAVNPHSSALGQHQVMPPNVPDWTRRYYKRELSNEEFRNNPEAQKAVFDGEMGKYLAMALKKANGDRTIAKRMASAAWYGGERNMHLYDNPRPQYYKGHKYPSFREYTSKVAGNSGKPVAHEQSAKQSADTFNPFKSGGDAPTQSGDTFNPFSGEVKPLPKAAEVPAIADPVAESVRATRSNASLKENIYLKEAERQNKLLNRVLDDTDKETLSPDEDPTIPTPPDLTPKLATDQPAANPKTARSIVNPLDGKSRLYLKDGSNLDGVKGETVFTDGKKDYRFSYLTDDKGEQKVEPLEPSMIKALAGTFNGMNRADIADSPDDVIYYTDTKSGQARPFRILTGGAEGFSLRPLAVIPNPFVPGENFNEEASTSTDPTGKTLVAKDAAGKEYTFDIIRKGGSIIYNPQSKELLDAYKKQMQPTPRAKAVTQNFVTRDKRRNNLAADLKQRQEIEQTRSKIMPAVDTPAELNMQDGSKMLLDSMNPDAGSGNYRYINLEDGETYLYEPNSKKIQSESLERTETEIPLILSPLDSTEEQAKNRTISQITTGLHSKFNHIPAADIDAFYRQKGFVDVNTMASLDPKRFFAREDGDDKDTFYFKRKDLVSLEKFSLDRRTQLEGQALQILESGRDLTPDEKQFFDYNQMQDIGEVLRRKHPEEFEAAQKLGEENRSKYERYVVENIAAGQEGEVAKINASKNVGILSASQAAQALKGVEERENYRKSYRDLLSNTKRRGASYETAQGLDTTEALRITEEELDAFIHDSTKSNLTPEEQEEYAQIGRELNETLGAHKAAGTSSILAASGNIWHSLSGLVRLGTAGYADDLPLIGRGVKWASGYGEGQHLAAGEMGKGAGDALGYKGETVVATTKLLGGVLDLPRLMLFVNTGLGAVGGFALNDIVLHAGTGTGLSARSIPDLVGAGVKGAATGQVFTSASVLEQKIKKGALNRLVGEDVLKTLETVPKELKGEFLTTKIFGTGVRLGSIYAGVTGVNVAAGSSLAEASHAGLEMVIFDGFLHISKMSGKTVKETIKSNTNKLIRVIHDNAVKYIKIDEAGDIRQFKVEDVEAVSKVAGDVAEMTLVDKKSLDSEQTKIEPEVKEKSVAEKLREGEIDPNAEELTTDKSIVEGEVKPAEVGKDKIQEDKEVLVGQAIGDTVAMEGVNAKNLIDDVDFLAAIYRKNGKITRQDLRKTELDGGRTNSFGEIADFLELYPERGIELLREAAKKNFEFEQAHPRPVFNSRNKPKADEPVEGEVKPTDPEIVSNPEVNTEAGVEPAKASTDPVTSKTEATTEPVANPEEVITPEPIPVEGEAAQLDPNIIRSIKEVKKEDTVTFSENFDYLKKGDVYTIESVSKKGVIHFRNQETGSGTFLSRGQVRDALGKGILSRHIEPAADVTSVNTVEAKSEPTTATTPEPTPEQVETQLPTASPEKQTVKDLIGVLPHNVAHELLNESARNQKLNSMLNSGDPKMVQAARDSLEVNEVSRDGESISDRAASFMENRWQNLSERARAEFKKAGLDTVESEMLDQFLLNGTRSQRDHTTGKETYSVDPEYSNPKSELHSTYDKANEQSSQTGKVVKVQAEYDSPSEKGNHLVYNKEGTPYVIEPTGHHLPEYKFIGSKNGVGDRNIGEYVHGKNPTEVRKAIDALESKRETAPADVAPKPTPVEPIKQAETAESAESAKLPEPAPAHKPEVSKAQADIQSGDMVQIGKAKGEVISVDKNGKAQVELTHGADGKAIKYDAPVQTYAVEKLKLLDETRGREELSLEEALSEREGRESDEDITKLFEDPIGSDPSDTAVFESLGHPVTNSTLSMELNNTASVRGETSSVDVIRSFENIIKSTGFQTPIRVGRISRKLLGAFVPNSNVIRTRAANDISTTAHEVAHALQKALFGSVKSSGLAGLPIEVKRELIKLGKQLYPNKAPSAGHGTEGFAEYVRLHLTTDTAGTVAPHTANYFQAELFAKNPKIEKAFRQAQRTTDNYRNQGALKRADANMTGGSTYRREVIERVAQRVADLTASGGRFGTNFIDEITPLLKANQELERVTGVKTPQGENAYEIASYLNNSAAGKVHSMINDGMQNFGGAKTTGSLNDAAGLVGRGRRARRDFSLYLWSRQAIDLIADGKDPGITQADAQHIIDTMGSPKFEQAANKVYEWQDGILDYVEQAVPELAPMVARIRYKDGDPAKGRINTNYVPLAREMDAAQLKRANAMLGYGKSNSLLARRGSGRRVRDIFPQIATNAENMIGLAHKGKVMNTILKLADVPDMGHLVEKIPAEQVGQRVPFFKAGSALDAISTKVNAGNLSAQQVTTFNAQIESLKTTLDSLGKGLEAADIDAAMTFFSPSHTSSKGDPIINVRRNGQDNFYQIKAELYDTLSGLDQYRLPKVLDFVLAAPVRTFKTGTTGIRAVFGLKNTVRDFPTYLENSVENNPALLLDSYVEGLASVFNPRRIAGQERTFLELYNRWGLGVSTQMGQDSAAARDVTAKIFHSKTRKFVDKIFSPIELMREIVGSSEGVPRIAEMKNVARQINWDGKSPITFEQQLAMGLAAKRITVDFGAGGRIGKVINQVVPFFNASIQGKRLTARNLKNRPLRTMLVGVSTMTIPTLAYWYYNKDKDWYKDMLPTEKYLSWHFQLDDKGDKILQIPRPQEFGSLFAGVPEALVDAAYRRDPKGFMESPMAKAMGWVANDLSDVLTPPVATGEAEPEKDWTRSLTDVGKFILESSSPVDYPLAFKLLMEQKSNEVSFFGTPIVSDEGLPASEQRSEGTTKVAEYLGKLLPYYLGEDYDVISPQRLDHMVRGLFGGAAMDIQRSTENLLGLRTENKKEGDPTDIPLAGNLMRRGGAAGMQSRAVRDFYDIRQKLKTRNKSGDYPILQEEADMLEQATKLSQAIDALRDDNRKDPTLEGTSRRKEVMRTLTDDFNKRYIEMRERVDKMTPEQRAKSAEWGLLKREAGKINQTKELGKREREATVVNQIKSGETVEQKNVFLNEGSENEKAFRRKVAKQFNLDSQTLDFSKQSPSAKLYIFDRLEKPDMGEQQRDEMDETRAKLFPYILTAQRGIMRSGTDEEKALVKKLIVDFRARIQSLPTAKKEKVGKLLTKTFSGLKAMRILPESTEMPPPPDIRQTVNQYK